MITRDLIADPNSEPGTNLNAVGVKGPSNLSDTDAILLELGNGVPFRLLDDDRNVYYYGRRLEESDADDDYDAEPELAPLDCFGLPNAGCTIQEEKNKEGKWEAIN
jgi:hypothetical protein